MTQKKKDNIYCFVLWSTQMNDPDNHHDSLWGGMENLGLTGMDRGGRLPGWARIGLCERFFYMWVEAWKGNSRQSNEEGRVQVIFRHSEWISLALESDEKVVWH